MNWIPYIITAFLLIAVFLDYRLKHIAKDRRTNEHKVLRRWLLWLVVLGILSQQSVSLFKDGQKKRDDAEKDRKADTERRAFEGQISGLNSNFEARLALINSNQDNFRKKHEVLVSALVTNSSIDPALRANVLAADKQFDLISGDVADLNAWVSDLRKRRVLYQLQVSQQQRHNWEEALPIFDYAIRTLQTMLVEIAKREGKQIHSDFKSLPALLQTDSLHVANITSGTNRSRAFEISIEKQPNNRLKLFLNGVCPNDQIVSRLTIQEYAGQVTITLSAPNDPSSRQYVPVQDYKKTADQVLRDFIASHAEQCPQLGTAR